MTAPQFSEVRRKLVHIAMGGFAIGLRFMTWWQAAALAGSALLFNLFVLPIVGRTLYRPADARFPAGILFYPLAILLLVLCFPRRLDIVAAAWGILAAGDGMATLVGRALPIAPLPWNRHKSLGGLLAFVLFGGAAAVGLAMWTAPSISPHPGFLFLVAAPMAAAAIAGFVETIPVGLDDNLRVPAVSAIVLASAALIDRAPALTLTVARPELLGAIGANAAVAIGGYAARTVTMPGAATGFLIGAAIWLGAGWQGWLLLLIAFLAAVATTKLGAERKALLGIDEERGGRRGAGNAIANTGLAAWCATLALLNVHRDASIAACVAALIAGSSDTVASEVGKAYGRRTWLATTLRRVPAGTPGAMSSEGTAAGAIAALLLAGLASTFGLIASTLVIPIAIAAVLAGFVEGLLGSTLEPSGILNNDLLNFITTAVAVLITLAAWRFIA